VAAQEIRELDDERVLALVCRVARLHLDHPDLHQAPFRPDLSGAIGAQTNSALRSDPGEDARRAMIQSCSWAC